ncbi:MAG: SO_0444 family Cu/Zn efflux transporter [Firmicutes bacterium]|nr:SO_0444 family Cu/Zn efflux transporter [Bacillota bacterium]MCM1400881.1 SO_0444 family Cu/Zn efflux transporter [Bacteroides sp.]MCM1476624.1 SO_0444 family Cu/Zn efflux transporter [Bacteroides sp.]
MELLHSLLFMLCEMSPYILLGFLIAGLMHAFIPADTFSRHLAGRGWRSVVKAAMVGIPLPLCSCGVLPTAIAMRRSGASRAASTSFLIATPQTGVDSITATWSLLGPAFAIIRPIAALATSFFGGVAVGKWEEDTPVVRHTKQQDNNHNERHDGFLAKIKSALSYGFITLVSSIGSWLVVGLVIAALITVYVPADFFTALGVTPLFSMIAVLIIAIPMYVCATGSIPIAMSLMLKGLSPGTALVLLMAGPAANFASFTLISREMGRKSALIYLTAIVIGAMAFGLAIDYLLPSQWFNLHMSDSGAIHEHQAYGWFPLACSAILVALLIVGFIKGHKHNHHINTTDMTKEYVIKGMNCPHCQAAVTKSILTVKGVEQVDVNLSTGIATVEGNHNPAELIEAVRSAGFDVA